MCDNKSFGDLNKLCGATLVSVVVVVFGCVLLSSVAQVSVIKHIFLSLNSEKPNIIQCVSIKVTGDFEVSLPANVVESDDTE